MNKKIILSILLFACIFSLNAQIAKDLQLSDDKISRQTKTMQCIDYKYNCYITNPFAMAAFNSWKAEEFALDLNPTKISDEEENKLGEDMHNEMINSGEYVFINNNLKIKALQTLLKELLICRNANKRSINYSIYLIDDKTINAFTSGGRIYLTTGIIAYCKTISELASVIAHEIGHNEEMDLYRVLKRAKIAGNFANIAMMVKNILTLSWNQFNEHRADCYGIALVQAAGYKPCATVNLWKRMADDNNENQSIFKKFFNTHPYSSEREKCLGEFIKDEMNMDCE